MGLATVIIIDAPSTERSKSKQVYSVKLTKGHDLGKGFDSDAAQSVMPRGFGGGLMRPSTTGNMEPPRVVIWGDIIFGKGCRCKHSWFTNEQIVYLLRFSEAKIREATGKFLRISLSSWHSSWSKMGKEKVRGQPSNTKASDS